MSVKQLLRVNPIQRNLLFTAAVFVITTAATVISINSNFTGEWALNEGKSDLGQYGARFAPKKLKIDGQTDAMDVERVSTNQNGEEVSSKEKITYDGKRNRKHRIWKREEKVNCKMV